MLCELTQTEELFNGLELKFPALEVEREHISIEEILLSEKVKNFHKTIISVAKKINSSEYFEFFSLAHNYLENLNSHIGAKGNELKPNPDFADIYRLQSEIPNPAKIFCDYKTENINYYQGIFPFIFVGSSLVGLLGGAIGVGELFDKYAEIYPIINHILTGVGAFVGFSVGVSCIYLLDKRIYDLQMKKTEKQREMAQNVLAQKVQQYIAAHE